MCRNVTVCTLHLMLRRVKFARCVARVAGQIQNHTGWKTCGETTSFFGGGELCLCGRVILKWLFTGLFMDNIEFLALNGWTITGWRIGKDVGGNDHGLIYIRRLRSPGTLSLLVPNIFLSTAFSNTLSLCFSLNARDQI